jgi:hypothetical protein
MLRMFPGFFPIADRIEISGGYIKNEVEGRIPMDSVVGKRKE